MKRTVCVAGKVVT